MHRRQTEVSPLNAALWMAVGAAAGVVVGVVVADRFGAGRALGRRLAGLVGMLDDWIESRGTTEKRKRVKDDDDDDLGADDDSPDPPDDADHAYFATDGTTDDDVASDDPESDDEEADDTGLDARVLAAFLQDPVLSERAVEIEARASGTIVLRGRVPSARDAVHAVTIARGTPGVERVENHLRVRRAHHRPPRSTSRH